MANKKIFHIIVFIIIVGCLTGCVTTQYANKSFKSQEIDRIVILPFMDNRKNPDPRFDFAEMVSNGNTTMIRTLKYKKKYRTILSGDIGNVSSYSVQDLPSRDLKSGYTSSIDPESVDPEWIKQLGPSTERWVLVPVIEEISHSNVLLQVRGKVELSVYLFNKHTGELWWQRSSKFEVYAGFIIYGVLKAAPGKNVLEGMALSAAVQECIKNLPKRTGPYLLPDK